VLVVACSSQSSIQDIFFDPPPPGKDAYAPVVRAPRRVPYVDTTVAVISKEYQAMMEELALEGPPPNWAEVYKKLPKDDEDYIDWMAALTKKIIKPSAGIDPKTPDTEPVDMDVELSTSGKPDRMVVFSHQVHTQWLACANCHPAIFEQEAGSAKITMAAIDKGQYCGVCHDNVAIALPYGCEGCHKPASKKS